MCGGTWRFGKEVNRGLKVKYAEWECRESEIYWGGGGGGGGGEEIRIIKCQSPFASVPEMCLEASRF